MSIQNESKTNMWYSVIHNITIAYKCPSRLARAVSGAINHPGSEYAQGCLLNKHIIMYMNPCLSTATIIIPIPYTSIDETLRISFGLLSFFSLRYTCWPPRIRKHGGELRKILAIDSDSCTVCLSILSIYVERKIYWKKTGTIKVNVH